MIRWGRRHGRTGASLVVCLALLVPGLPAVGSEGARVTRVKGKAEVLTGATEYAALKGIAPQAPWRILRPSHRVAPGDAIRTGPSARVELTFTDGSRVRLAAGTTITLQRAHFEGQARQVRLRIWLGRLWARVTRKLGGASVFEVRTANAVAGVRGTSFAVMAQADLSSVVKVYTGTVGVKKKGQVRRARRVQVAGPEQVDRAQWEEIVATAMRQVRVTQLGEILPAEDFVDTGSDRAWARWNQGLDGR